MKLLCINHKTTIIKYCISFALVVSVFNVHAANRFGMGRSIGRPAPITPHHPSSGSEVSGPHNAQSALPSQAPMVVPAHQNVPTAQAERVANQRSMVGSWAGAFATGVGVSWLIHSMGWGQEGLEAGVMEEQVGTVLIILIGIAAIIFVIHKWSGRKSFKAKGQNFANSAPSRFERAGSPTNPVEFQNYKAKNVGNDASARPWEGDAGEAGVNYSNDVLPHYSSVPNGFDARGFVNSAKEVFMTLQEAWDRSDMGTLHKMLTDQMLAEIKSQLSEREQHSNSGHITLTDVVTLQAELLGIQESVTQYTASVEFSGLIREDPTQGPSPFREVWSLCRPKDNSTGWLVAGVQALQ